METFELKYFLAVAKTQNIHKASEELNVSPGSLSKAISRLEDELTVVLFDREGRNIKLTDHGRLLQKRAAEIIHLEESARLELSGHSGNINIIISGPEILLFEMGINIIKKIKEKYEHITVVYKSMPEDEAVQSLSRGECHLALVTNHTSINSEISEKLIDEVRFQTVIAKAHPIYKTLKKSKEIPIDKLLEISFIGPDNLIYGQVGNKQSNDGWRDDKFRRKIEFKTSSIKIIEKHVLSGMAVAYLPDYLLKNPELEILNVSGCNFSCTQKIYLLAKKPKERSWLRDLF